MTNNGSGRSHHKVISLPELAKRFPDEASAVMWIESVFWADGRKCPRCIGCNTYETKNANGIPYRCRDCRRHFSVKTGNALAPSKLPVQIWVWAVFLKVSSLTGVSCTKLHRDLGIPRKTAWRLVHRIREGLFAGIEPLIEGSFEVDEVHFGGLEKNTHEDKKLRAGLGTLGKSAELGVNDRKTKHVRAKVVQNSAKSTIQNIVTEARSADAFVFTDEHHSYEGLANRTSVTHSQNQWAVSNLLSDLAQTNGIESFWAILKRAYHGTFRHLSKKHFNRYVTQFVGKHNVRDCDTIDQMVMVVRGIAGKRLRFKDLVAKYNPITLRSKDCVAGWEMG